MDNLSSILLVAIVLLIPVTGFILMIGHARKADTAREQRWRKSHGLIFWVFLPTIAGILTMLGARRILPGIFALIGIVMLAGATSVSMLLQKKREG